MLRTQKGMGACTTIKIIIQSLTLHFMMMMISLHRICAAYMVEDAIILKEFMIILRKTAAIMNNTQTSVVTMMTMILSQQRHVVFARPVLRTMTTIVQKKSVTMIMTHLER